MPRIRFTKKQNKIGNSQTYVEADITNNKLVFYVNGQKVQEFG